MEGMRKRARIFWILSVIPVLFFLFLLAVAHVVLLLAGVAVVLSTLLLLRAKKPEWFSVFSKTPSETGQGGFTPQERLPSVTTVYMVLAGRESFGTRNISVNKTTYSIGRGKDNDFVLEGHRVSRHHLRIEYNREESVSYAIDMGSRNGSFLNRTRMEPGKRYPLATGDQIMIDDLLFDVNYAHY